MNLQIRSAHFVSARLSGGGFRRATRGVSTHLRSAVSAVARTGSAIAGRHTRMIWLVLLALLLSPAAEAASHHKVHPRGHHPKSHHHGRHHKPVHPDALTAKSRASQQKLQSIHQEINHLQKAVTQTRRSQAQVQSDLHKLSGQIASTRQNLAETQNQRDQLTHALGQLKAQRQALSQALTLQRHYLKDQLRAAYMQGTRTPLQLWLEQKNPTDFSRALEYYRRLNEARIARMQAIEHTNTLLADNTRQIQDRQHDLLKTEHQIAQQQTLLETQRETRQALALELQSTLKNQQTRLKHLNQDARTLNNLIARLAAEAERRARLEAEREARLARAREAARKHARELAARREREGRRPPPRRQEEARLPPQKIVGLGQLPAPVAGPISVRYGTPRTEGGLLWQGVVFNAAPGSPVRAIAAGRVVYAGSLRGYGTMIILDHGNGLLSLYSHLQHVLSGMHDKVTAGERIASVGADPELGLAGLYFEIRRYGKPVNPLQYLRLR